MQIPVRSQGDHDIGTSTARGDSGFAMPLQGMKASTDAGHPLAEAARLGRWLARYESVLVLTGAGCSTDSGIPDYRDGDGGWKRAPPMPFRLFVADEEARRRYWARSQIGWRRIVSARPNDAHRALARLEREGRIAGIVTQNVDGLHQRAGSRRVIDLHGRLDRVECLDCGGVMPRRAFQERLDDENPHWSGRTAPAAPDGDAELPDEALVAYRVPPCPGCGGIIKPSVVFFGENVPAPRVTTAMTRLAAADALLVVGSSLMVWSGYRFLREARRAGKSVVALNLGRTRGDAELEWRLAAPCAAVLGAL